MKIEVIKRFSFRGEGKMCLMMYLAEVGQTIELQEGIARRQIALGFAKKVVEQALSESQVGEMVAENCLDILDENQKPKKKSRKKSAKQSDKQNKLLNTDDKEDK